MEEEILTHLACPHVRVRLVPDPDAAPDDETAPLIVRLDDEGHASVVGGWQGHFNISPVAYAWKHFGDARKVSLYLAMHYDTIAEFVGVPDRRTFAYVVLAHPQWVSEFGGEGEEHPGKWWIRHHLRQTSEQVAVYAAHKGRKWVLQHLATGSQNRSFDDGRGNEVTIFSEWEDTCWSSYVDLAMCESDAWDQLNSAAHDCKNSRKSHGA